MGYFFLDIETYVDDDTGISGLNPYRIESKIIGISYNIYHGFGLEESNIKKPRFLYEWESSEEEILRIYASAMPPSSSLTPSVGDLFENIAEFILKYSGFYMINLVRYKPTGKIVAVGSWLPSPFSKDEKASSKSSVDNPAFIIVRILAVSLETIGKTIGRANIPSS